MPCFKCFKKELDMIEQVISVLGHLRTLGSLHSDGWTVRKALIHCCDFLAILLQLRNHKSSLQWISICGCLATPLQQHCDLAVCLRQHLTCLILCCAAARYKPIRTSELSRSYQATGHSQSVVLPPHVLAITR